MLALNALVGVARNDAEEELQGLREGIKERLRGAEADRESVGEAEDVQPVGSASPGALQPAQGQDMGAALPAGQ